MFAGHVGFAVVWYEKGYFIASGEPAGRCGSRRAMPSVEDEDGVVRPNAISPSKSAKLTKDGTTSGLAVAEVDDLIVWYM